MALTNAMPPIPSKRVITNYEQLEGFETFLCVHTVIPMDSWLPGYDRAEALAVECAVNEYKRRQGMADVKTVWKY
jgi:hypothetical protein